MLSRGLRSRHRASPVASRRRRAPCRSMPRGWRAMRFGGQRFLRSGRRLGRLATQGAQGLHPAVMGGCGRCCRWPCGRPRGCCRGSAASRPCSIDNCSAPAAARSSGCAAAGGQPRAAGCGWRCPAARRSRPWSSPRSARNALEGATLMALFAAGSGPACGWGPRCGCAWPASTLAVRRCWQCGSPGADAAGAWPPLARWPRHRHGDGQRLLPAVLITAAATPRQSIDRHRGIEFQAFR